MAKFALRAAVRKVGQQEVRSVQQIREGPDAEPLYFIQLGRDFATNVWAKENELEAAHPKAGDTLILRDGRRVKVFAFAEGVVDISPDRFDPPIQPGHLAPTAEPNTWELVGISSSDFSRY